jgi:hypothetical protein
LSLFFDVWTSEGFVLVSDVRIMLDGKPMLGHKLARAPQACPTNCAIAVCGEYPQASLNFFSEATSRHNTLRDIARTFASRWTERFGGTQEYSAVHLVGFEEIAESGLKIPQMWFWANWSGQEFAPKSHFEVELATFDRPIPANNHIPHKIKQLTGKFPEPTPEGEAELVRSFLSLYQPFFTWNGDTAFWRSAASAVGSAMNLLWREKANWSIRDATKIATECLRFLANVGSLLEESTVGLSPDSDCDVLEITPQGINARWVNVEEISKRED